MTTALILLAVVLTVLWGASLWRALRTGGGPVSSPRHAESDWGTASTPTRPYNRVPRLP